MLQDRDKIVWAAGFISINGTFTIQTGQPCYVAHSGRFPEAVNVLAEALGHHATVRSDGRTYLSISGYKLHVVMTKLWPYLPTERKAQYVALRDRVKTART